MAPVRQAGCHPQSWAVNSLAQAIQQSGAIGEQRHPDLACEYGVHRMVLTDPLK